MIPLLITAALTLTVCAMPAAAEETSSQIMEEQSMENSSFSASPIISRNVPAYSGSGRPNEANDDVYYTSWRSEAPDYLAYDLSGVPEAQRGKVLAVWYNSSSYDQVGSYVSVTDEPTDYVLEINHAPGGSFPEDGWEIVETVSDNTLSTRSHLLDLDGANWIRMRITGSKGGILLNFDIHDASSGGRDSWIFFGDSITAGGMINMWGTSYATFVHAIDPAYTPLQQNGGIGGITSKDGREYIDKWLTATAAHYVSIAYGTNDSWGNQFSPETYYENTKYMIDAVLNAGRVPVLPKIPHSTNPDVGPYVTTHNAMIDRLYEEYGDRIVQGPDFEAYFKEHPEGLGDDGVHPNSDGYEEMRKLWAETMYEKVYTKGNAVRSGDVNGDGTVSAADVIMLQKYLLNAGTLTVPEAAELYTDGVTDVFDLAMLKRRLLTQ